MELVCNLRTHKNTHTPHTHTTQVHTHTHAHTRPLTHTPFNAHTHAHSRTGNIVNWYTHHYLLRVSFVAFCQKYKYLRHFALGHAMIFCVRFVTFRGDCDILGQACNISRRFALIVTFCVVATLLNSN